MDLEELNKKIEDNANKILTNSERIESNSSKIDGNSEKIQENSCALDILKDYKNDSKRLFIIIIVILIMWFLTIGYLVYILNDIGTIEETNHQEIEDVGTIENSNIINGDMNG